MGQRFSQKTEQLSDLEFQGWIHPVGSAGQYVHVYCDSHVDGDPEFAKYTSRYRKKNLSRCKRRASKDQPSKLYSYMASFGYSCY